MAKIRTLTQLQEALDAEMSWRIKEISHFKLATKTQPNTSRTFVRAGVTLVYAHWEGFIKSASESYLNFVENQGHKYRDLKTCFAVFGLKAKLVALRDSRKAKPNIDVLDFVISEIDRPAKMGMSSAIDTESNLTSKIFSNIATSLDISTSSYETKFKLIDESLVHRRNKVAHGEYLDLPLEEFMNLADEVLQMMRSYKTDIENAASLQGYRRLDPAAAQGAPAPL